jgi:hypothetical protein
MREAGMSGGVEGDQTARRGQVVRGCGARSGSASGRSSPHKRPPRRSPSVRSRRNAILTHRHEQPRTDPGDRGRDHVQQDRDADRRLGLSGHYPAGTSFPGISAINWVTSGMDLANGGTVSLRLSGGQPGLATMLSGGREHARHHRRDRLLRLTQARPANPTGRLPDRLDHGTYTLVRPLSVDPQ